MDSCIKFLSKISLLLWARTLATKAYGFLIEWGSLCRFNMGPRALWNRGSLVGEDICIHIDILFCLTSNSSIAHRLDG